MILYFHPAAQLPAPGAERPALGVRGGADAAPAAGGTRELPAGPAPVQLPAPVQCSPVPSAPAAPGLLRLSRGGQRGAQEAGGVVAWHRGHLTMWQED